MLNEKNIEGIRSTLNEGTFHIVIHVCIIFNWHH